MESCSVNSGTILITGSSGFVGRQLCARLISDGRSLRCAVHNSSRMENTLAVGDIGPETVWTSALTGVDAVVHLAARAHIRNDTAFNPLAEFRRVNVEGTLNLARQAAEAGIKRFIFLSTVKVNGEQTSSNHPFTEQDPPSSEDPYGISKHEAEKGLCELAEKTGIEVVIIRPPLVYGPGVKANFLSMMRWLNKDIPLPLGAIHNKRSLVALDNLVDLIVTCIEHPAAANQTFLAGDGEDLSTTELLRRMAKALERPARLIPVPSKLLELGASMLGKRALSQRLCGSLQVDISKARELLGWTPPVSVDEALRKTAEDFLAKN
jgi:nucleoside-diphosphate-sugar epimerase